MLQHKFLTAGKGRARFSLFLFADELYDSVYLPADRKGGGCSDAAETSSRIGRVTGAHEKQTAEGHTRTVRYWLSPCHPNLSIGGLSTAGHPGPPSQGSCAGFSTLRN